MTAQHVITVKDGIMGKRVEIECQSCKSSMDVSATSALGAAMIENWPKLHKCPKPDTR